METSPAQSNLCALLTAVRAKVTESEKPVLKPETRRNSPTFYESPAHNLPLQTAPGDDAELDEGWHIRDNKLWPVRVHGSMLLYVHRNRRLIRGGSPGRPPWLSHSSWTLHRSCGPELQLYRPFLLHPLTMLTPAQRKTSFIGLNRDGT